MDCICKELEINSKNIFPTTSADLFTVVVHSSWLKKWMKNSEVDNTDNIADFPVQSGETVPYPWRKILIRVLNKKVSKVLPLPRYKLNETNTETSLTFSQLLQYVSQTNQRTLWKESYKKYCQNNESPKESTIVNLLEHDQLVSEVILRLYGCNVIKIKNESTGKLTEYKEIIPNKYVSKCYETHVNLLAAMFALETDNNYFIVYRGHYENNLLDCLNFSPALIDKKYTRGLFVIYQLINAAKAMSDRGLSLGMLELKDIFLNENLWLQIVPVITNNIHPLDASLIYEHNRSKQTTPAFSVSQTPQNKNGEEWGLREEAVQLEKLCLLWVKGRISNLDYLLHLNTLTGRTANDPQARCMVPWVTDFSSRCGRNWRDLSKSKYRLNKGDKQLDMTYDAATTGQTPHHVSDALSDITCYVYLARRTPKDVLCKHVRNKWVPAEYPASIQRVQEWTPDECIPEFYTDPSVFKSIHEDLPDLGIPSWATCVEDFITRHREALESAHVSENLHHWIDITFGYKLSGAAAVKAKNVCLSLVDDHTHLRRGGMVQLFAAPHPPRQARAPPPAPPRLHWTAPSHARKSIKQDSSDELSDEDDESRSVSQHVARVSGHVGGAGSSGGGGGGVRARRPQSSSRSRPRDEREPRASSHSRHYRVQRSELGKGIIYLPKEFNPIASIQNLESLDNFRSKCFFSTADDKAKHGDTSALNMYSKDSTKESDDTAFTNHMFLAAYDQSYLKKFSQDAHLDGVLKERKNRSFNTRYTTDAAVYKQFVTESRRQDMLVIGCLIVEIFLHAYMRPLRTHNDFTERYNNCRRVLRHNFHALPKCVSYIASLLLNVPAPGVKEAPAQGDVMRKITVTDRGLPAPAPAQLLQPLLAQHLVPFPPSFSVLYSLLSALHEYELTANELHILYMYQCDGVHCDKYKNIDKTKLYFTQRIAEGKIQACVTHLDVLLSHNNSQFDVLEVFLSHYVELLNNKDTSVLAAWYLFDTVAKALGPSETKNKLLRHILNLYEDEEFVLDKPNQHKLTDVDSIVASTAGGKEKFVKLYHNIFLLQLMVRLGLQCFLDNFTQHLVEAVGGYKDGSPVVGSPGHLCHNRAMSNKKPRYSDDNVKNALATTSDIFSPDTSYGSEHVVTPSVEKNVEEEHNREKDSDNRSENELFHFETDKDGIPSRSSRSKSPAGSIDSFNSNPQDNITPSPSREFATTMNTRHSTPRAAANELNIVITKEDSIRETPVKNPMSPNIDIPKNSMFTSYIHFAEEDSTSDDVEVRKASYARDGKSLESTEHIENIPDTSKYTEDDDGQKDGCKISDMSSESLIWLAHRLGPVLTCRHITRNLLKMLTLCYIGKDNLVSCEGDDKDAFEEISIVNCRVAGDRSAMKVIHCLTSIVEMYGEQLVIFQYLPHMGELIASCRKRLTPPLEGGVVACLQLLKHIIPYMSDAKLMEQLQDTFLKSILLPALRLASSGRAACPHGAAARAALARKLLGALHALALRVGPEITKRHLAAPALQRFFLAFDKASGKTDNWPKQEESAAEKLSEQESEPRLEGFLEICRDGSTAEWTVQDGRVLRADLPDLACTPPDSAPDAARLTAQEELLMVFDEALAYQAYTTFEKMIGADSMERALKNMDTIRALCDSYKQRHSISSPIHIGRDKRVQASFSDEPLSKKTIDITPTRSDAVLDHISSSNSFGSNVTLVGNRIEVACDGGDAGSRSRGSGFDVVACKMDNGVRSNRHLRGDWLIYWEHEIGRPDKDTRFNLKQIKLQTFSGHTHSVKSIHCLDNENSFMSGSKDKTVRLWSLRNQGDGNATTHCNWAYTGHKKGVLSLAFLESLRLAVSTDSVVHIWDPFMESIVSQLECIKSPVSIVRSLGACAGGGGGATVLAATTDATLQLVDARTCRRSRELKLPMSATTFVRCMCVCASGAWVACGLASGHVAVLDTRTGLPLAAWRAHDGEVLRLAAVDDHRLLSSGLDQITALWRPDDGELIAHLKGSTEPVHCLSVYYNELISGTTNNRIGVHTSLDTEASFSSTKLRSDTFKGVLTCMSVLPLNRLLLLGSDNGTISLLC